jgi:hypothetical protein
MDEEQQADIEMAKSLRQRDIEAMTGRVFDRLQPLRNKYKWNEEEFNEILDAVAETADDGHQTAMATVAEMQDICRRTKA